MHPPRDQDSVSQSQYRPPWPRSSLQRLELPMCRISISKLGVRFSGVKQTKGSPTAVPVPWHSTTPVSDSERFALLYVCLISSSCASALGVVKPSVPPSAFDPDALITARMGLPSRMAWSNRLIYSALTASPRAYTSAEASKVLQFPSGARVCCAVKPIPESGARIKLAPHTTAPEH